MSVPDREQLIRDVSKELGAPIADRLRSELRIADVLLSLERLGYPVTPAESPAEAPEQRSPDPEAPEAAHTAELTRETFVWTLADNMRDATGWDACGEIAEQVAECFDDLGWRAVAVETEETPT